MIQKCSVCETKKKNRTKVLMCGEYPLCALHNHFHIFTPRTSFEKILYLMKRLGCSTNIETADLTYQQGWYRCEFVFVNLLM